MRLRLVTSLLLSACMANAVGAEASSSELFRLSNAVPPGFEALTDKQSTQADVYYGGIFLLSTFVTFDMVEVELEDPSAVVEAIPNVRDPYLLATTLTGPLATNALLRCTSRRADGCGKLTPEVAGVIFDESTYRLDLFIAPDQLHVHELSQQRYLPPPVVEQSSLHNVRISLSGLGSDSRFTVGSESYLAWKNDHIRTRYSFSDSGFGLSELSWQRDDPDMEYEVGSFRSTGRELAFAGEVTLLGGRMSTSTKTRTDLLQAQASPIYLFLDERSQVNVFRGDELIDSTFLDAGNHELDTRDYPDGAYDIRIEMSGISGARDVQNQFFVRSHNLPAIGEPSYFFEGGVLLDNDRSGLPRIENRPWVRFGASHRLANHLSLDTETIYADGDSFAQSGLFVVNRRAQVYAGAMVSSDRDFGYLLRASYRHRDFTAFLDLRQLELRTENGFGTDSLLRRSYLQGSASLGFPLGSGRMFVRAQLNKQAFADRRSLGVSYLGPLFNRWGFRADLRVEANFSNEDNWFRTGITFRRLRGLDSIVLNPSLADSRENGFSADFDGYWNGTHRWDPVGDFQRSTYFSHQDEVTSFGSRFMPKTRPGTDLEIGVQQRNRAQLFYALNNSFNVVTTPEKTTIGAGGSTAGAVVIDINGAVEGQFEVRVDSRVAGYAWANRPNVISLRPYETYRIRVNPISDDIVGFDESVHEITVYPGNVEVLSFAAYEITVLVGQAVDEEGQPLKFARFKNSIGLGLTDTDGWYQIEVKDERPLLLAKQDGSYCQIELPKLVVEQNLAVLDVLACLPVAQPDLLATQDLRSTAE